MIQRLSAISHKRIALIENEIGRFGTDGRSLDDLHITVSRVLGGCACCQSSGNLLNAVVRLQKESVPDILFIELSGLAMPENVIELLTLRLPGETPEIACLYVIDSSRFEAVQLSAGSMVFSQAQSASVIVLNRSDLAAEADIANMTRKLQERISTAEIIAIPSQSSPDAQNDSITRIMFRLPT